MKVGDTKQNQVVEEPTLCVEVWEDLEMGSVKAPEYIR